MKEVEANKQAWNLLAEEHYKTFKARLKNESSLLNRHIIEELGDIAGKRVIHLQCNTGADSICLARMGAIVTGVDLAPDNIKYARQLAEDFNIENIRFIESDILELTKIHQEKYDIVFTSEGTIGWMPDINRWAETIRALLKDNGYFYVNEGHPIFFTLDEEKLQNNELVVKYPYFGKTPDVSESIGGYASDPKEATTYFWMYTMSDIVNALIKAGLKINFLNEYDVLGWEVGEMEKIETGMYRKPYFKGKFPFSFSIKASVSKG